MIKKSIYLSVLLSLGLLNLALAQKADDILGQWYNTEKDAKIEIFKDGGKYFGRVVWLKDPVENGKPVMDANNSDKSKRTRPIIGMKLLEDFEFKGSSWENGSIYDPRNGKTYSSTIKKKAENILEVRGFIGVSLIGRTVEWTKAQ
ncbi:DUF2147 domain-containing protein [Cecembia lonarensis]|uniref:DUF2147 domain-containing protein n=1 Tax=Cecembia lonarensis (strain CCUG 58316 / KCTC 22772 / LW9) TaxID=1225176 RepID=K1L7Q1_CECL9|nr:DUF2147 domain-containing protein [Cecembia lonarensis]EKB50711.1 hypothetical protein B879_00691 [Cecembia lonarensis LW9]